MSPPPVYGGGNYTDDTDEKSKKISEEFVRLTLMLLHSTTNKTITTTIIETKAALVLLKQVERLEEMEQGGDLEKNVKIIAHSITLDTGGDFLQKISNALTGQKLSWGRIISLHLLVFLILRELCEKGRLTEGLKNTMPIWLGDCLVNLSPWINTQEKGWFAFEEMFSLSLLPSSSRQNAFNTVSTLLFTFIKTAQKFVEFGIRILLN